MGHLKRTLEKGNSKRGPFPFVLGLSLRKMSHVPMVGSSIPIQMLNYLAFVKVAQLCPTLCDPMDYTVHGILYARILGWVAFPISRGSSQPQNRTQVDLYLAGGFFANWAIREGKSHPVIFPPQPRGLWLEAHPTGLMSHWHQVSPGYAWNCSPLEICFPCAVHNVRPQAGRSASMQQGEAWTAQELKTTPWKQGLYTPIKNIVSFWYNQIGQYNLVSKGNGCT